MTADIKENTEDQRKLKVLEAKVTLTQPQSAMRQFVAPTGSGHNPIHDGLAGETGPKSIGLVAVAMPPSF